MGSRSAQQDSWTGYDVTGIACICRLLFAFLLLALGCNQPRLGAPREVVSFPTKTTQGRNSLNLEYSVSLSRVRLLANRTQAAEALIWSELVLRHRHRWKKALRPERECFALKIRALAYKRLYERAMRTRERDETPEHIRAHEEARYLAGTAMRAWADSAIATGLDPELAIINCRYITNDLGDCDPFAGDGQAVQTDPLANRDTD